MLFSKVLLFAAAASAAVIRRDLAETQANLADINSQTQSLTGTVNGWDGSTLGAISIQSAANALGDTIESATGDLSDESQASSADTTTILSYVSGTLDPSVGDSLDAVVARRADFQSAGVAGVVRSTLTDLRSSSAAYSDGLIALASDDQKDAATAAKTSIDDKFAAALSNF